MTQISFYKYQGAGNDFVLINFSENPGFPLEDSALIEKLCDRRFGIGADGLIVLKSSVDFDFEMIYFNADGHPGSMCGNGGRCIVAFAHFLGLIQGQTTFLAVDGPHEAKVVSQDWIELQMINVESVEEGPNHYYMNTGSPHYIEFVPNLAEVDVDARGKAIRYNERFNEEGTNVNFVQATPTGIKIGTYERGVEAETLACGTGVTAAAMAHYLHQGLTKEDLILPIEAKGGQLEVRFKSKNHTFQDVWLCGPAKQVFSGRISI